MYNHICEIEGKKMSTTFETKLTQSIEVQKFHDKIRNDLELLQNMPLQIGEVIEQLRGKVLQAETNGQGKLTPKGLQEQIDGFRNQALAALDDLEERAKRARENIERALAETMRLKDDDVMAAILREIREERAWARIRPLLEKTDAAVLLPHIRELARRAAEAGDDIALGALEAEIPAYLEFRGVGSEALAALAAIAEARLPHLPPAARRAIQVREELAQSWPRLMGAFMMARGEASGRSGKVIALPGWKPNESAALNAPGLPR